MARALWRPILDVSFVHEDAERAPRLVIDDAIDPLDALAARAAGGDEAALSELITRSYDDCWRFARRMLGDQSDAEDAVQETFVRVYRAIARYEPRQRYRGWLFRILANRCRTIASSRRERVRRFVADDVAVANAAARSASSVSALEAALEDALRRLDPTQREAFLLKFGEELEYEEISEMLGVGISALKMRVSRARAALRLMLAEER